MSEDLVGRRVGAERETPRPQSPYGMEQNDGIGLIVGGTSTSRLLSCSYEFLLQERRGVYRFPSMIMRQRCAMP